MRQVVVTLVGKLLLKEVEVEWVKHEALRVPFAAELLIPRSGLAGFNWIEDCFKEKKSAAVVTRRCCR